MGCGKDLGLNFDQINRVLALKEHGDAEVAVVVGLGFVGAGVAAALARARRADRPPFFVIGLEQPTRAGDTKVGLVNQGIPPLEVNDPELGKAYGKAVHDARNLVATTNAEILTLADVVIVCVNLDLERTPGQTEKISCDASHYVDLMRMIGGRVRAETLVCVESTLPVGTCDKLLYPAFCQGRESKDGKNDQPPLFAYCYERVTPGSNYLNSVDNYWRAYAGIDDASAARAVPLAMRSGLEGKAGIYNIGSEQEIPISELVDLVFDVVDFHPEIPVHLAPEGSVEAQLKPIHESFFAEHPDDREAGTFWTVVATMVLVDVNAIYRVLILRNKMRE